MELFELGRMRLCRRSPWRGQGLDVNLNSVYSLSGNLSVLVFGSCYQARNKLGNRGLQQLGGVELGNGLQKTKRCYACTVRCSRCSRTCNSRGIKEIAL